MKIIILQLMLVALLLASCKKDHQSALKANLSNAKKYPVSFTLSQFAQTTGSIYMQRSLMALAQKRNVAASAVDTSAFAQAIFEYFYLVYDLSGKEVKRYIRNAVNPGFLTVYNVGSQDPGHNSYSRVDNDPYNVITDSLTAGTYTVVITGNTYSAYEELEINLWDVNNSRDDPLYLPLSTATVYTGQGLDPTPVSMDIFFGKCTLTVKGPTQVDAITLNRIVGEVEVDLKDAVIPSTVSYILLGRSGEMIGYSIANETPNTSTYYNPDVPENSLDDRESFLTAADYTKGAYIMQRFVLNTVSPIDIIIVAYDKNNNIIASKTVPQVQIQKNRRTILSGKLFDSSVTAQFTITANAAWGPDTPPISFYTKKLLQ